MARYRVLVVVLTYESNADPINFLQVHYAHRYRIVSAAPLRFKFFSRVRPDLLWQQSASA